METDGDIFTKWGGGEEIVSIKVKALIENTKLSCLAVRMRKMQRTSSHLCFFVLHSMFLSLSRCLLSFS